MLTRLYVDNFRCFVNFEYRPERKQLILGRNGSGKSSLLDALLFVRQFAVTGVKTEDLPVLSQRTRWLKQPQQTFEIESEVNGQKYVYRLILEPWGEPPQPRVHSETVHCDGQLIFEFAMGEVHLYNDRFQHKVTYPFDWHRSALATITARKDNHVLTQFKQWFSSLFCFRIDPFLIGSRADKEDLYPNVNISNLASWYRHLVQADPKQNAALLESLRNALDAFGFLRLEAVGENARILLAEFTGAKESITFGLNELSEGQRCLIGLYTILHFVVAKGNTVILDEPDNFLSLREIQPWLMSVSDHVEDGRGQVLIISHHPELINQWAPRNGVQFVREGLGAVRAQHFTGDPESNLSPAELVARGWEHA